MSMVVRHDAGRIVRAAAKVESNTAEFIQFMTGFISFLGIIMTTLHFTIPGSGMEGEIIVPILMGLISTFLLASAVVKIQNSNRMDRYGDMYDATVNYHRLNAEHKKLAAPVLDSMATMHEWEDRTEREEAAALIQALVNKEKKQARELKRRDGSLAIETLKAYVEDESINAQ